MTRKVLTLAIALISCCIIWSCNDDDDNTVKVSGITLDTTAITLIVGQDTSLTANITPTDASDTTITWESSSTDIATVDTDGTITAVAAGTATVTASAQNGTVTASCTVTVLANEFTYNGTTSTLTNAYVVMYDDEYDLYLYREGSTSEYIGIGITPDLNGTTFTPEEITSSSLWGFVYTDGTESLFYYGNYASLGDITTGTLYVEFPDDEEGYITANFNVSFSDGTSLEGAYYGEIYSYEDKTSSGRVSATHNDRAVGTFQKLLPR